jgi:hypothetical protein
MIRAWAADIDAGRDPLLLAYRRDNVEMSTVTEFPGVAVTEFPCPAF